jgi:hypothetical protein
MWKSCGAKEVKPPFITGWRLVRQKRQCHKCLHYVLTQQQYCCSFFAYSLRMFCIMEVFYSSRSIFKWFPLIHTIRRFGEPAGRVIAAIRVCRAWRSTRGSSLYCSLCGVFHVKWTKFSAFRFQNETFHVWGQDSEQFWWFFQNFKKVGFLKNSNFNNILNGLWNKTKKKNKITFRSQNETFHVRPR